jgi:hypothetical protein
MFYVRRKDDPKRILAFGHAEPGRYQFDLATYEEVEGELPQAYVLEEPPKPLLDRLTVILESIPRDGIPVAVRAQVRQLQAAAREAIVGNDLEVARYLIASAAIPEALEGFRQALLAECTAL